MERDKTLKLKKYLESIVLTSYSAERSRVSCLERVSWQAGWLFFLQGGRAYWFRLAEGLPLMPKSLVDDLERVFWQKFSKCCFFYASLYAIEKRATDHSLFSGAVWCYDVSHPPTR